MARLPSGLVAQGLDLGSNTFSFCELVTDEQSTPRLRHEASIPVRLSEGLTPGGRLKPTAIARGIEVLDSYKQRFGFFPERLRAVGTAVLRLCSSPEDFTTPASELLGVPVEIITSDQEARTTYRGAILGLPPPPEGRWVMMDIGGQSTELGWMVDGQFASFSLPLGVVGMTEQYLPSDPPTEGEVENLRAAVRRELLQTVPRDLPGSLVCVAGTATSLGFVALELTSWNRERLHGLCLSLSELTTWNRKMQVICAHERTSRFGVSAGRADVFPAGLTILEEVLCYLHKSSFTISASGLRVGVALSVLEQGVKT